MGHAVKVVIGGEWVIAWRLSPGVNGSCRECCHQWRIGNAVKVVIGGEWVMALMLSHISMCMVSLVAQSMLINVYLSV